MANHVTHISDLVLNVVTSDDENIFTELRAAVNM